ncbi:hypothetical protein N9917_00400 [Deltaproteobacteria bacterium]|nr:hypothetical protein [Deltaproteobacteria bacterium]
MAGKDIMAVTGNEALDALANFTRSVGQSDEARDLLAVRLGVRVRGWRGRIARNALTEKDIADMFQAYIDIQAWA